MVTFAWSREKESTREPQDCRSNGRDLSTGLPAYLSWMLPVWRDVCLHVSDENGPECIS